MPRTETAAPKARRPSRKWVARLAAGGERICEALALPLHRLVVRMDLLPPEFGRETPVDETDPRAVLAEWRRYLKLWGDYNPQEIFALKVGAALLLFAILAISSGVALLLL